MEVALTNLLRYSRRHTQSRCRISGRFHLIFGVGTFVATFGPAAVAGTYTWDPVNSGSPNYTGTNQATWSTSGTFPYWLSGGIYTAWQDTTATGQDTAVFQSGGAGEPGQVIVGSNVSAFGVLVQSGTFAFSGTSTLKIGAGGIDSGSLSPGALTFGNPVTIAANQTWNTGTGVNQQQSGAIGGSQGLTKAGAGQLTLTGNNDFYTGAITVSGGTLQLATTLSPNKVTGKGSLTVTGDGSRIASATNGVLQLGASNQINDTVAVTLAGGTFSVNGQSEGTATAHGMGTLTLASATSSAIDFGNTAGVVSFADSRATLAGQSQNGGNLFIYNWNGSSTGSGANQLFIGTSGSQLLSSDQLAEIQFVTPSGSATNMTAKQLGSGELVPDTTISPTPEPSGLISFLFGIGGLTVLIARRRLPPA